LVATGYLMIAADLGALLSRVNFIGSGCAAGTSSWLVLAGALPQQCRQLDSNPAHSGAAGAGLADPSSFRPGASLSNT
jgi:hypothetical protein